MNDRWLTKGELIDITGVPKRTLQRLLADGKCRYRDEDIDTPRGKRTVVLIDPFSLPTEYLDKYIAQQIEQTRNEPGTDLGEYADWQIRTAIERRGKLQEIRGKLSDFKQKRINRLQTTGYLEQLCKNREMSIHTYYRWDKAEKAGGMVALIPGWGTKSGCLKDFNTEQKQFLISVYGDQSQPKIVECNRLLADYSIEKGLPAPSINTTRRFLADLPENFKDLHRKGPKYYDDKHRFYILRDYTDLASNAIWCSDHHQLNIYIKDYDGKKGFPWLTVWQDMASRKIMGWWLQVRAGNSRTIAGAFRHGVLEHGIPERVYIDNGKDYRSRMIAGGADRKRKNTIDIDLETKGIFMELKVEPVYAWPYHPQSKPVERFFRTLDEQFSKKFEGYRGHNVANRPERVDTHIKNSKKNGKVMHVSELSDLFSIYINERYNLAPHKGDGMEGRSPALAWQDKLESHLTPSNPAVLDLLMMPIERKKVGRIGVRLFGGNYYHADMVMYKGKEVDVRYDTQDLSKILVFDPNGRKICEAVNQERLSWNPTEEEIKKLEGIRKQEKKALTDIYRLARERTEMPDIRKQITAGHNSYAGPDVPVDRKLIDKTRVKTRLDEDCGENKGHKTPSRLAAYTNEGEKPEDEENTGWKTYQDEGEDDESLETEPIDWKTYPEEDEDG